MRVNINNLDDVKDYLDRRIQVLFAGSLAQSLTPSGVVDEDKANGFLNINAKDAYSKARELIHLLRSITYPLSNDLLEVQAQLTRVYDDSWKKAIRAVQRDYKLIKGLGRNLSSKIIQSGREARLLAADLDALRAIVDRFGHSGEPN